jgi:glycosyltransferase involved in cell wall biosynthesis
MTPARQAPAYRRLIMLGTAFESRGGISAVVNAYRASGLFERWPIDYVPTHRDGGAVRKLLTLIKALLTVIALLGAHRRVVVHVHSASRASFWRKSIFMAIAMLAKCPVILHLHGGGFARFYEVECGKVRRRMIRFFLERAARVIVLSERWRAWITGITDNRRVVCIPNLVAPVEERPLWPRRNIVLFLGRLERRKGIFDLLDAIAALRAHIPDLRLVCAGDGDLGSVARYAERLGIEDAVSLPGWVGPAEKQSLMNLAAVYVLPSYAEGLPVSLLEAMASGLPVAATSVGGIPDVVADGINGFLFAPGDSAMLQRLLRRLMHDAELGKRMALAARETVRLRFSAERVLAQLDELYAGLGLEGGAVARECAPAGRLREAA